MNNVYLEFQDLASSPQRVHITKEATRLGREPGLDVVIASTAANVSRRHAEIRRQEGVFILVDLGSFNGTFLNGRRIVGGEVLHGARSRGASGHRFRPQRHHHCVAGRRVQRGTPALDEVRRLHRHAVRPGADVIGQLSLDSS